MPDPVYARSVGPETVARLRHAIERLEPGDEPAPSGVDPIWVELVRWTLDGWVTGVERDLGRAEAALVAAARVAGAPADDDVAALEECLWRLTAATEKLDALIALAFDAAPLAVANDGATTLTMRPSRDRNKAQLQAIGSDSALRLVEARAALSGERARLRRHQIMHSLPPIDQLDDLAPFIRVHHRDGRIFGYELVRWTPERWDEGITSLTPETLFARRVLEARRGVEALVRVIDALAEALEDEPVARVPQSVYYDHDTQTYATVRPEPTGPPKSYEIDFLLDTAQPPVSRRVSSPSKVKPGTEIPFDDGVWRVIRVADGEHGADQTAICRLVAAAS